MHKAAVELTILVATILPVAAWGQSASAASPSYHVSWERQKAVSGIGDTFALQLPFECTSDGTIFVSFVGTTPADAGIQPPLVPPLQLVSISPAAHGQVFRLDQVPELYISREIDHYASDSEVIFLVEASRENKPAKQTVPMKDGSHREFTDNAGEKQLYILTFSRDGEYRRTTEVEETFRIQHLGIFPSGTFLAFGFEEKDDSPKLAMLKDDGTLLKFLQISKGDVPESMVSGADAPHPHTIAPTQLVPEGRSILVVQNDTTFPLLEVGEGGALRAIHPKLPKGDQIDAVIPSDRNLYIIARPGNAKRADAGVVYELSPDDGAPLRRFELSDGRRAAYEVACIHDGKFLSIDYGDGSVIPLVGSPERATGAGQPIAK